ncbi:hypothetical protein [Microbacterium protaetiae]|uniref:hypothetical protein n=1 Tax=Microbacterium protaetiae TaxID=2509458 RepID=UPI0013EBDA26|nr:hypothetical protein [Microbacterium protaetiae]
MIALAIAILFTGVVPAPMSGDDGTVTVTVEIPALPAAQHPAPPVTSLPVTGPPDMTLGLLIGTGALVLGIGMMLASRSAGLRRVPTTSPPEPQNHGAC